MVLNQTMMPAQVMPNMWGVQQEVIEGLSLLGPLTCAASWLASLVEWVEGECAKRATLFPPVTPVKDGGGKSSSKSAAKKSKPKLIPDFWDDPEKDKEDEESEKWEEERWCRKSSSGPILSLADHEEPVSSLISKTIPHQVSQPADHPSWVVAVVPKFGKDQGKTRRPSPSALSSSDDSLLPDKELDLKSKSCKRDYTSPVDVVVMEDDDDELLSSSAHKTPAKKAKTYTPVE